MKKILSISFCFHDSSIAFSDGKSIVLHMEAERFFNKKHKRFLSLEEVDEIVKAGLKQLGWSIEDIGEVLVTKWNNLYDSGCVEILGKKFKAILTGHHNNHIGTSYPSNFKKCVILCSDGGSEDGYTKLYYKNGNSVKLIENWDDRECTGKFYGTIAQMLIEPYGPKAHTSGVGKLMGLSSYGKYDKDIEKLIIDNIKEINSLHFDNVDNLLLKFKLDNNYAELQKNSYKTDIAYTAHRFWVEKCKEYLKQHNKFSRNICLVGGCALNITLNSELLDEGIYDNVYVSPVSTDAGQSIGAILFRHPHILCNYPYLGREKEKNLLYDETVIDDLLDKKIIAWYQGRAEVGARALGKRSFLGIPTDNDMKKRLSEEIKQREPYRPVACVIPEIYVSEYFEQTYASPYMTFCSRAKEITKKVAPAIVHVDGTTRVQTINKVDNPVLYDILIKLKERNGVPMLMNTSLNIMGDPIVDDKKVLQNTFEKSNADCLYIDGVKYKKEKLVSIIVATYNNDKKLIRLLESLKNVSILEDKNIEVIIVQNCANVESYEKTKSLEKIYNIKVYHEPRQGKGSALNKGIIKSNGKYIVTTDDDVIVTDSMWIYKFIKVFEDNPNVGYVSGKVIMNSDTANEYSKLWENKGGLSKGEKTKYWSSKFLKKFKYKIFPWPMFKICAGANQMIKKEILLEIGGYSEFLGKKENVDGLTLEIGYKFAKKGYELIYDPNIYLYHEHPVSREEIEKKLYYYGMQDTGSSMYIYLTNNDYRYLWWAIFGHLLYTMKKVIKSLLGLYPLSVSYLQYSIKGNLLGWKKCLKNYRSAKDGNNI